MPEHPRPLKTLERVLSKAGLGSRTEARSWIGAGRVEVNGKTVRNPDHWVDFSRDRVTFDGKPARPGKKVYILLYKPKGYLTTYRDPEGPPHCLRPDPGPGRLGVPRRAARPGHQRTAHYDQ